MKVLLSAAAAAALMVSSAAFAAGPAVAASPTQAPATSALAAPMKAAKPVPARTQAKSHVRKVHRVAHLRKVRRHRLAAVGIGDATKALNLLEAQGYGSFANFRRDGRDYDATVSQNGKTFQVKVDPATSQITRG